MDEVKDPQEKKKSAKKSFFKKLLKFVTYLTLSVIGLTFLLYGLLSLPAIQNELLNFTLKELRNKLRTEISVDKIHLNLFNHVTLSNIYIADEKQDTLLFAKHLDVTLSPMQFIKHNKLEITGVALDDFILNLNKKDNKSDFNFQFIINAFSSKDTTKVDTTKSSLAIQIENISIRNGRFNYDILSDSVTPKLFNAAHLHLYDLNAEVDLNSVDPEKLDINVHYLRVKEESGLEIKELKSQFFSDKSKLWSNKIHLLLPTSHLDADNFHYDFASSDFAITTHDAEIYAQDLLPFLPSLKYLRYPINLKTTLRGKLPMLDIQHIQLDYGNNCTLNAKAYMSDYSSYGSADIYLDIEKLRVPISVISDFVHLGDSTFVLPEFIKRFEDINLKGKIKGKFTNFDINVETWAKQGAVSILAKGVTDSTFQNFNVNSVLNTKNLALNKIIDSNIGLGKLSTSFTLKADRKNGKDLSAQVYGNIEALEYKDNVFNNIPIKAYYDPREIGVNLNANLPIGNIFADISMTQDKIPDISVDLRATNVKVDRLYKNHKWVNPRLSLNLKGNIKGFDIDKMTGDAILDSIDFHGDNFIFRPGPISLDISAKSDKEKSIRLSSSILSGSLDGQYSFTTIADEISVLMQEHFPSVFEKSKKLKKMENNFSFNIITKDIKQINSIFPIPFDIPISSSITGNINTNEHNMKISADIPSVKYGETIDIQNLKLDMINLDSIFNAKVNLGLLMDKGRYDLSFNIDGIDDGLNTLIKIFSNDKPPLAISGEIGASAKFSKNAKNELISTLHILPSDVNIEKLKLSLLPSEIKNIGKNIEVHNLGIALNDKKYIGIEGVISDQPSDTLKVSFEKAQIETLLATFDFKNIQGCIDGDILATRLLKQPEFYTNNFSINDIMAFNDTLGNMKVDSQWSSDFGGIKIEASLQKGANDYAEIDGFVYPTQDSIDMQIRLEKLPVDWMQPFVKGFLNKLSGSLSTNLTVRGNLKAPQLRGFLGFNNTQIGVDYTNVVYTVSDTLRVSPDKIGFENLTIKDPNGNMAKVNATISHKNFEKMTYLLDLNMNNLLVLNTEHRTDSLFYGRVFTSGNVKIDGNSEKVDINMQVKNEKNSLLNILLPQHSEATGYKSLVYINIPQDKLKKQEEDLAKKNEKPSFPLQLNVKLDVTPDLLLKVVINPATGDEIQVTGLGDIEFSYNMQNQNMAAYGEYDIANGTVKLNLQNIKKIDFKIDKNSKLYFVGDPLKTKFSISAYKSVKADLKTLDPSFESDQLARKPQVDCILDIDGNMDKMNLHYDIDIKDVSDDVKRKVNSLISTEDQKIKQFVYLVAFGHFYPVSGEGTTTPNVSQGVLTNLATTTLSSGLNQLFGSVLGDKWQIGTNIDPHDGNFNDMDVSVNLSTKFLDDKLKLNTNLGYRTNRTSESDNPFIGDFEVEYEINRLWTIKAYNHTNDEFYKQSPMTQGIGIVYTKEANTLRRLFQWINPRRKRRSQSSTPTSSDSTAVKQNVSVDQNSKIKK